jgi:hypothetical protein
LLNDLMSTKPISPKWIVYKHVFHIQLQPMLVPQFGQVWQVPLR